MNPRSEAPLPILRWPDPRLARPCAPADPAEPELRDLSEAMLKTMYDAPGRGLAAPQVGRMIRLFVMDVAWKDGPPAPQVFVNPEIVARSAAMATREEGCLSIPGPLVSVTRPAEVMLRWIGLDGVACEAQFDGFAAACVQHEIDHLDGIVILDRVPRDVRAEAERVFAG